MPRPIFVPDVEYNTNLKDLKGDLERVGFRVDPKTIRKYLDMASSVLDPEVKEDLRAGR
jgi:hypothetical protein